MKKVWVSIFESGWSESELMGIIDMQVPATYLMRENGIKGVLISGLRKWGEIIDAGREKEIFGRRIEVAGKYKEKIFVIAKDGSYHLITIHGRNPELHDPLLQKHKK